MSSDRIIESSVPSSYSDVRLDIYLSRRFNYMSRTSWQREIESGRVRLNGAVIYNVKKRVVDGDRVEYNPLSILEPDVDFNSPVIFENENFFAVCKSGNLPVHPSGIFFHNTLVMFLEEKYGKKFYPVHRLDRETSGVILFGKSSDAASSVQKNFDRVKKEYLLVARGATVNEFTVDVPIGSARNSLIKKKREAYPGAEEQALTSFKTLKTSLDYSIVKASPLTGRMHQIRVHMKYSGHPIVGDKMYSDDEKIYIDYVNNGNTEEIISRAGFDRCALHSSSLVFFDHYEKKEHSISAELPEDLKLLLLNLDLQIDYNRIF